MHRERQDRQAPEVAGTASGIAATIRRWERRTGVFRPGRSPVVWIVGPGLNAVVTFGVTMWAGSQDGLGWPVSVGLGLAGGTVMGAMAWAFMGTSFEQEEDERRVADALATRSAAGPPAQPAEVAAGDDRNRPQPANPP